MSNDVDLSIIYGNMLAGCVPIGSAQAERVITLLSQDILDTTLIHRVYDVKDGYVFYMSIPSKELSSMPNFSTPLAAAFSSHPQHQGDGVYLMRDPPNGYALIRRGNTLRLLVNQLELLDDAIAGSELPVIDVTHNTSSWRLTSTSWMYRTVSETMATWMSKMSVYALASGLAVFLISEIALGIMAAKPGESAESMVDKANVVINKALLSQPLSTQIARVQNVSSTVVRAGGWIEEYQIKGSEERFLISLPTWVSKDYLDSLGKGIITEVQDADSLIWVRKGNTKLNPSTAKSVPIKSAAPSAPVAANAKPGDKP